MTYQLLTNSNYIKLTREDGTVCTVPDSMSNRDWQAYQAWLAADPENEPLPADEE